MERFHRYHGLRRIRSSRRLPMPSAAIERDLECSRAIVSRIIEDLRNYGAPIEYLRVSNKFAIARDSLYSARTSKQPRLRKFELHLSLTPSFSAPFSE